MPFTRSHHQTIAAVLGSLDAEVLRERQCFFVGGTALALRFGEYRESVDVDFVVADADAYRELRDECRQRGFGALAVPGQRVVHAEPLRIDQYGIRTRVTIADAPIKFEIIREARIELDPRGPEDAVLGVATTTLTDLVAMKLLANSDRWLDPTVFSRDIIDLAMIRPSRPILTRALTKAAIAYGDSVVRDARSAIAGLREQQDVLDRCQRALGIREPRAVVLHRLHRLAVSLDAARPA